MQVRSTGRAALECVAKAGRGGGGRQQARPPSGGRAGLVFGDGDRVLDKGVWKRWKMCEQCQQILVERAKWKDCWEEVRFCSDRCRAEARRGRRREEQQPAQAGEQPAGEKGRR